MRILFTIFAFMFGISMYAQTYDPTKAGTALNKGIAVRGIPVDSRSYYYDAPTFTLRPFTSTTEVLSYFNTAASRAGNFNIYITIAGIRRTYQFRDGVADGNLVVVDNIDATSGVTSVNGLNGVVSIDKNTVSLGNVDNTSDATKNAATATLTNKTLDAATTKYGTSSTTGFVLTAIDNAGHYTSQATQAIGGTVVTFNGQSGAILYNKDSAGLANVDNTSDANKPISNATNSALANKQNIITPGTSAQYLKGDLSLGTLNSAAVGLGSANNTSDANKPVSTAQQTALDLKANAASPVFSGTLTGTYTIGGTPTFPSVVTQNAASQSLTNKTISGASNTLSNLGTISNTPASTTVAIGFSTGTGSTLPAATHSLAGVLTAADKTRFDSIYNFIQSTSGAETVHVIDGQNLRVKSMIAGSGVTITNNGDTTNTISVTGTTTTFQQFTDGTTITINCASGLNWYGTLGGNRTLALTNPVDGMYISIEFIQDGSGNRTIALPAGSKVINGGAGALTLSTSAGAIDWISGVYRGTTWFFSYGKNFN